MIQPSNSEKSIKRKSKDEPNVRPKKQPKSYVDDLVPLGVKDKAIYDSIEFFYFSRLLVYFFNFQDLLSGKYFDGRERNMKEQEIKMKQNKIKKVIEKMELPLK